ncbi:hypothetical protein CTA2_12138 [Colletotrichum tanaceti]|uniref:Uncharacterized protein n=1 Tax=Colletotrichum tanaceti TaxID=1306861 RepID=A0A4U6XFI3_9PEZI|nr:hypothetical protein CTA2_12138 [Colletotrichum tanaceti]TKW54618.1 hypothetical protein CTA1_3412 [Colletotrichum tanaceti]
MGKEYKSSLSRRIFLRKGFTFDSGPVFPATRDGEQSHPFFLAAVFGDQEPSGEVAVLSQGAHGFLVRAFRALVDLADLYGAPRGHEVFYDTVVSEIAAEGEFNGPLLKVLEETYVSARQRFQRFESKAGDNLVTVVDAWIRIKDAFDNLPALRTFSLSARADEVHDLTSQLENATLASINPAVWLPVYFNHNEVALLSSKSLRSLLHGKTPETPGAMPALPTRTSVPTEVRGFLCSLALAHYRANNSSWRLLLTPVAQMKNHERCLWAKATGGESQTCFSLNVFTREAMEAMRSGKSISIALATPWFGRAWGSIHPVTNATGVQLTAQQVWSSTCPRLGFAIVLHKHDDGVELIIFDPIARYTHIKEDPVVKANLSSIFAFRQSIRDITDDNLRAVGARLTRVWYGGKMGMGFGGSDSVQIASEWVRQLIVGAGDEGQDPLSVNDNAWAQWEFEKVQT